MRGQAIGLVGALFLASFAIAAGPEAPVVASEKKATTAPSPKGDVPFATAVKTTSGVAAVKPPEGLLAASEVLGKDVLDEALSWDSAKYAKPSSNFRAGGVRKKAVDAKTVSKVGGGFKVRFASGSQVTTPAVHDGMLFVSGGFSSQELYAYDAKTGKPVWALELDDDGPSAPACVDGVCVINTESCTLFVVEAKTGKLLWAKWLGDPLMSAPTIAHGRVYASYPVSMITAEKKTRPPKATHALAAFDLKSGKLVWQKWIDGDVISSPVATEDRIWAATFSGTIYEFESGDGKIASAKRSRATSAPVVVAGNLYFSARKDTHGRAGEAQMGMATRGVGSGAGGHGVMAYVSNPKAAAYLDRNVQAASSMSAKGKSEDSANGFGGGAPASANADVASELVGQASVSTLQAHQGSRVVSLPGKNVSTMGDEVICNDAKDGKKLWSVKLEGDAAKEGGSLAAPPIAAGKFILVGTVSGEILQIDREDGKIVKRYPVGGPVRAQPIVQDGWIYASTADGRLVAIDTGDKTLTGWSQWGGDAGRSSIAK